MSRENVSFTANLLGITVAHFTVEETGLCGFPHVKQLISHTAQNFLTLQLVLLLEKSSHFAQNGNTLSIPFLFLGKSTLTSSFFILFGLHRNV